VNSEFSVVICGAGPAGLSAAYRAIKGGIQPLLVEGTGRIGGLARTENYKGYRFDIGGHRFFTKDERVLQLWLEILGDKWLKVNRRSRIYYRGRFLEYPIEIRDALAKLGIGESALALLSYLKARLFPYPQEKTFEHWVVNRFGRRLYEAFFKTYTEKVWGIPCDQIHAEWAAQRIRGLSFAAALRNCFTGSSGSRTLVREFLYPPHGPGMMWEYLREKVERMGGVVRLNSPVVRVNRKGQRICSIITRQDNQLHEIQVGHFVTSMPLPDLIPQLDPPAPPQVVLSGQQLKFRAFLLVGLIVDQAEVFTDNWLYIHSPNLKVGRVQNFKNWSPAMVPDPSKTSLGMEYFCSEGDAIWSMPDGALIELATRELCELGLVKAHKVVDGVVFRQPKAYPVYSDGYRAHVKVIQDFLASFENLHSVGRNGMHRYNNMDHSMLTAMLAVENILGANHNHWEVNTDQVYHEERESAPSAPVGLQ
jgi:protoporphyrinogen oxidase